MGLGRFAVFYRIVLPQASLVALPVYKSAVVNLLQWTCVVGYISITDLTARDQLCLDPHATAVGFPVPSASPYTCALSYLIYGLFSWLGNRRFGMSRRYLPEGREMISVQNISKAFGDKAVLDNVSAEFTAQERVAIIGQSGAGKSVFLRCLNGLERP